MTFYDELPQYDLTSFDDEDLVQQIAALIGLADINEMVTAGSATIGHVYTRNSEQSFDQLGSQRNNSYGRDEDDLLMQVTLRIPQRDLSPSMLEHLRELKSTLARKEQAKLALQLDETDREIEQLEEQLARTKSDRQRLVDRKAALSVQ